MPGFQTVGVRLGILSQADYIYSQIEILLKKVRLRKCEPLGPIDRPDFHNYMNRNFAQKSATWKV